MVGKLKNISLQLEAFLSDKKWYVISALAFLVFFYFALVVPPLFADGHHCLFRFTFGLPCPGCGVTTAIKKSFGGSFNDLLSHPTIWIGGFYLTLVITKNFLSVPNINSKWWVLLILLVTAFRWF
jgi:hypothetical protein